MFNTVRMFDEFNISHEEMITTDCLDLQETHSETEIFNLTEQLTYNENIKFTTVIFETNEKGELVPDINGNYIEKYSYEDGEISDSTRYNINW